MDYGQKILLDQLRVQDELIKQMEYAAQNLMYENQKLKSQLDTFLERK